MAGCFLSCSTGGKPFSIGLVDYFFNRPQTALKPLEKCSIEKRQSYQLKPVAVETVNLNHLYVEERLRIDEKRLKTRKKGYQVLGLYESLHNITTDIFKKSDHKSVAFVMYSLVGG